MIAEDRAKMKQEQEQGKWFRGGDAAAMPLFPREMFTGLNTGICTKGYASFRDNAKVLEPSLCCSVPSLPTSSPGGLATKAETLPPARCGCTRSSMTAFVSSPRR